MITETVYANLLDRMGRGGCPPPSRQRLQMTTEYGPALVAEHPHGGKTATPLPNGHNVFLGAWIVRSPYPNTPPWEWVITNMSVTVITGMSSGYCWTKAGARRKARRALKFWKELGYRIDKTGTKR